MSPEEAKTALTYGKYIALDTESTGLQPNDAHSLLLEIGAVKVVNGQIVDRFNELINPGIKIKQNFSDLTGITNDLVQDKDSYASVLARFREWCDTDKFIFVMHNAPHDVKFLNHFGEKCGVSFNDPCIDTQTLGRNILRNGYWQKINSRVTERYSLASLGVLFSLSDENHHRALNDAELTWGVFDHLRKIAFKKEPLLCYKQDWKYPVLQSQNIPSPEQIKLISICPWEKKKRIYVNLSAKSNSENLFTTVFYDFAFKCWGIKENGFPIKSFKEIENAVKNIYKIEDLRYESFSERKYLNSYFLNLNSN